MGRHQPTRSQPDSAPIVHRVFLLLFLTTFLTTHTALAAERLPSPDERFVNGLLSRRLFSLAEAHCQEQLSREDLSLRRRAELAVELSRTHTLRALSLPSSERDVAWLSAFEPLTAFQAKHGESSYSALTRRQQALVHRAHGDLLRQEAEVVTTAAPFREQSREELRQAITILSDLDEQLTQSINQYRKPARGEPPQLTENELRNLREEIRYQLARTLVSQGLTYPAGSADRTNSIVRAKKQYAPLAERDEPIDWNSRLALARCERLLQNEAVARQRLALLLKEAPAPIIAAAKLELARLNYDVGQLTRAREALQARLSEDHMAAGQLAAEWDYEFLRTLLAIRKAEKNPQAERRLDSLTNELVQVIEREHGAYWLRRAEALLGRHIAASPQNQDAQMLARAAANFYRSDKPDEAIATYDQAAEKARAAGSRDQAFDLAYTSASIEHHRKQHEAASERYRRLSMSQPQNKRAAQAHLLAIFNAAQLVRGGGPTAIDHYIALLEEHLTTWPEDETAAQANIWLGKMRQARRDWAKAIGHYRQVPRNSPLFPQAIDAVIRGTDAWLASFSPEDAKRRTVASRAAAFYTELLLGGRGELPQPLNEQQRQLLLAWARTRMIYLTEGYDELEPMLRAAIQAAGPDATPQWKTAAQSLLVLALAGQPRRLKEATAAAEQLELGKSNGNNEAGSGDDLIRLALALNALREAADGPREQQLAELQLTVVAQFDKLLAGASPTVQRRLKLARAAALVEAKRFDKAKERFAELAKELPNDRDVQLRYAKLLSHPSVATGDASWQAALTQWRLIERRSDKASGPWFEAKYHQALAHYKMGNAKQALRIIQLTQALHPDLGGKAMQRQFAELKKKCE